MKTAKLTDALKREFPHARVLNIEKEDGLVTLILKVMDRPLSIDFNRGTVIKVTHSRGSSFMDVKSTRSTMTGSGWVRLPIAD